MGAARGVKADIRHKLNLNRFVLIGSMFRTPNPKKKFKKKKKKKKFQYVYVEVLNS
jgi:hypothetical protein